MHATIGTAALFALVCGNAFPQDAITAGSSTMDKEDRAFMKEAASGGMLEVKLGQVAADKGSAQAVKNFGQRMVADHSKVNGQLTQLMQAKGLTPPAAMLEKHQKIVDEVSAKSGNDFDKAYIHQMVKDHKEDIALFKKEEKDGKDVDLQALARTTLPVLREHLRMAEDAHKTLIGEDGESRSK